MVTLVLWSACFITLFGVAAIDRIGAFGWGYSGDIWVFLGFAAFAPCFWLFATLILNINLAFIRHTYGDEPSD